MGKRKRDAGSTAPARDASIADALANLKKTVREQQKLQTEADERAREAFERTHREALAAAREQRLLETEFSDVVPLKPMGRIHHIGEQPEPKPVQRERDEQAALMASLSDEIDIERYLDTDEELSYAAPAVGPEIVTRLRRGAWKIVAQLDLHGLRRDEAREVLVAFLDDCRRHSHRCVRVIHGKGLGSVNREPVLKSKVRKWLVQRPDVLAFCQAPPNDGGGGALLVLLAGSR